MMFFLLNLKQSVAHVEIRMNRTPSIGAVILAAGASLRMGTPKQFLSFNGRTLIRHTAETALASRCHPVMVVTGAHSSRLRNEISNLPVQFAENRLWDEGIGSSIRTGIVALQENYHVRASVIILCDQPFVSAQVINDLIAAYETHQPLAVASEYGGTCGVPALFSRPLFSELISLQGTRGAKQVLKQFREQVICIPVPAGTLDIDTPEDYARLKHSSTL